MMARLLHLKDKVGFCFANEQLQQQQQQQQSAF